MELSLMEIGNCPCCGTVITVADLAAHSQNLLPCPNCNKDLRFGFEYEPSYEEYYAQMEQARRYVIDDDDLPF